MASEFRNSDDSGDVHKAIGLAVSHLLSSGKPVDKDNILAQLKESEKRSVDGTKKVYAEAVRKVAQGMD